jgi:hypothetical protein
MLEREFGSCKEELLVIQEKLDEIAQLLQDWRDEQIDESAAEALKIEFANLSKELGSVDRRLLKLEQEVI